MICLGQEQDLLFQLVINLRQDVGVKIFKAMFINNPNFLDHCGLLDNPLPFGVISIILNQDIIHHFLDIYGKTVLVKCGCYISQAQVFYYLKGK